MSLADAKRAYALYWPAQAQRNRGVLPLFALVTAMLALYVYLFPGFPQRRRRPRSSRRTGFLLLLRQWRKRF